MGHWQHGQRHGQGKWTSAPKAAPTGRPAPAADPGTQAAPAASQHAGPGGGSSSSSASSAKAAKEVRETYVGGWVGGKREGHGVAEYADGGRCVVCGLVAWLAAAAARGMLLNSTRPHLLARVVLCFAMGGRGSQDTAASTCQVLQLLQCGSCMQV